jgi:hypothetical protein
MQQVWRGNSGNYMAMRHPAEVFHIKSGGAYSLGGGEFDDPRIEPCKLPYHQSNLDWKERELRERRTTEKLVVKPVSYLPETYLGAMKGSLVSRDRKEKRTTS